MSVLTLEKVSYIYDKTTKKVLNNISYDFEKGKIYAIVGKSGAGKTTLLSVLSGLTSPTSGNLVYEGRDTKKIDRYNYRSRMVGVIFQGYNLLPQLTAEENVVLSMDISGKKLGDRQKAALKILESIEINRETAKRKVLQLSGGEQQRVAIARVLSYDPGIILADEPTGNLDGETESGIMDIFTRLAKENNKCVIIVTHSQKVASYADIVIRINEGKIQ